MKKILSIIFLLFVSYILISCNCSCTNNPNEYQFDRFIFSEDGKTAQVIYVDINDSNAHTIYDAEVTSEIIKEPTCTEKGITKYIATYIQYTNSIDKEDIEPLGHDLEHIDYLEPTTEIVGHNEYYHCTRCDKYFSDQYGQFETAPEEQIIPVLHSHVLIKIDAVASTCISTGNIEYYYCSLCEKYFSDSLGEQDIKLSDTILPLASHAPQEAVLENEIEATCTDSGSYDEVIYCSVCNQELSREHQEVSALGHNYVITVIKPTTTSVGYTNHTCSRCGDSYNDDYKDKLEAIPYTKEDNQIYFGEYPQTVVSDTEVIAELDKITTTNEKGYFEYEGNQYAKVTANPYNSGYKFSDNTTITSGKNYYFKVEPIKWQILEETDDSYLIISNLILDVQCYYPSSITLQFKHNDGTGYANNYELSSIRQWLNKTFYNTAFNDLQKELIKTVLVDNSASTTANSSNQYACNDTYDKIFLLSYQEAETYYTDDASRKAQGTDYAKANFLGYFYGNSCWWLRSPSRYKQNYANYVDDGSISFAYYVNYSSFGVRCAMWINK